MIPSCSLLDQGKKFKGDVMDLRLDIERRKRLSGKGRSPGGSRERSSEKAGKHHKKSKKAKKKRDRSPSSSSSSSSPSPYPPPFRGKEYGEGPMEHPDEGYPHQRYPPHGYGPGGDNRGPREYEGHMERGRGRGFFPRVRGRGWNRGNYQGNNSNGNPANMNPQQRPQRKSGTLSTHPRAASITCTTTATARRRGWTTAAEGEAPFPTAGEDSSTAKEEPAGTAPSGPTTCTRAARRARSTTTAATTRAPVTPKHRPDPELRPGPRTQPGLRRFSFMELF
ncbi:hypothetical protein WMY93_020070 [Mugilogobius chulae]|uniref:Uncharacterized protein n=1 Tax=Mugilogobius chulae TaxID=88201 RepID=A0AAW0NR07_9GOBI